MMMMMMMMMMIVIIIIIIGVAIPGDRNVIKKEAEKILKYKDLIEEIQRMWNVKAKLIPVIIRGDWNRFKITRAITEQHTGKARN
jgi:hypothetical protein